MLTVRFWKLGPGDEPLENGSVSWNGKKATLKPPLKKELLEPYYANLVGLGGEKERGMKQLSLKDTPELFLTYLFRYYRGFTFWADPAVKSGE